MPPKPKSRWMIGGALALAIVALVAMTALANGTSGGGSAARPAAPGGGGGGGGGDQGEWPGHGDDCGTTISDPTAVNPDSAVGYEPCPGDDGGVVAGPQPVTPKPGMSHLHPIGFDHVKVGSDDKTLTIVYWSGIEPCYVLDHVEVKYGDDAIRLRLFEGSDPSAKDVACIEIAMLKSVTITLDEPVNGRTILDGSAH